MALFKKVNEDDFDEETRKLYERRPTSAYERFH